VKISYSGITAGIICIIIGVLLLSGAWGSYANYSRLDRYSGRAVGHITNKHIQKAADGNASYYLEYWYEANGIKINASGVTAKQQWDVSQVNDTMEVRYDKGNPGSSVPMYSGSPSLIMAFFMTVLAAVFLIFGGSRLYYSIRKK